MERLLKIAELKQLEKQVALGEISYSKMVEIINFKHLKELSELRFKLNNKFKSSSYIDKQKQEISEDMNKQETIEEAAEKYVENYKWEEEQDPWFDFIEGAKWMQERMYSEEDMIEFGDFCKNLTSKNKNILRNNPNIVMNELLTIWFEQFKKK